MLFDVAREASTREEFGCKRVDRKELPDDRYYVLFAAKIVTKTFGDVAPGNFRDRAGAALQNSKALFLQGIVAELTAQKACDFTELGNVANPYYTFQPELIFSYLKDGWNLSAALSEEINTQNSVTHYTTGNLLHADFTATKTIGKWTFGPVAYYVGQVTNDSCPIACAALGGSTLAHVQNYSILGVGGLVGYDFGPASLSVWATREVSAKASNAAAAALGADVSLTTQGTTVNATLSYRIWAPDEPAKPAMYRK
jgi:Putative MetA-pathway of phenol degradation